MPLTTVKVRFLGLGSAPFDDVSLDVAHVAQYPCLGAVEGIGDDWDEETGEEYRHHACQGHIARDEGEPYIPEHAA